MGQIAVAVRHLIAAGVSGDDLVQAIEEMEQESPARVEPVRSKAAVRQARYRDRKKASQTVTKHNEVTKCDARDVTDEELSSPPLVPPLSPIPPNPPYNPPHTSQTPRDADLTGNSKAKPKRKTGTRLDADWQPSPAEIKFARQQGATDQDLDYLIGNFVDHWTSTTKNPTKTDWTATWRNHVRQQVKWGNVAKRPPPRTANLGSSNKPRTVTMDERIREHRLGTAFTQQEPA